jgi:hypothetical protein
LTMWYYLVEVLAILRDVVLAYLIMICCSLATHLKIMLKLHHSPDTSQVINGYSNACFFCLSTPAATSCNAYVGGARDRVSPASARGRAMGGFRISPVAADTPSRRRRPYPHFVSSSSTTHPKTAMGKSAGKALAPVFKRMTRCPRARRRSPDELFIHETTWAHFSGRTSASLCSF